MGKMKNIIEISNVSKEYVTYENSQNIFKRLISRNKMIVKAINDLSLSIEKGELIGYIGPNGAGKSTTIKIITGVISPTNGTVQVMGCDPQKNRKKIAGEIGVVFGQKSQLWWDLPVRDSYLLLKEMYRINNIIFHEQLQRLDQIFDIAPLLDVPVRQLSLGQRMKCDIVAALLHDPEILFLDEPTIGVDIMTKENLRKFIREINQKFGKTIIITSHDMQDVVSICKRLVIIDSGNKIYDGQINDFIKKYHFYKCIKIGNCISPSVAAVLKENPCIYNIACDSENNNTEIEFDDTQISSSDIYKLLSSQCDFQEFTVTEQNIERIIEEYCRKRGK